MEICNFLDEEFKIQSTLEQRRGEGAQTLRAGENPCITLQSAVLCPQSCPTVDHVELKYVFTYVRGPAQLKPALFKGQM